MTSDRPYVELRGVSKRFGGVQAVADVTLGIAEGRVHALVGENGAGKSTLGKIVAGLHRPSSGELRVHGQPVAFGTPRAALAAGIVMMQQEVALVPGMTVLENIFLGMGSPSPRWVNRASRRRRFEELRALTGADVAPDARVGELRIPEQQQVELMRALARGAGLIVLDEPTASLTRAESERMLDTIGELRDRGTTIVFVSHALDEVLAVADVVTVMRSGRIVRTAPAAEETKNALLEAMLGRAAASLSERTSPVPSDAPVLVRAQGVATDRISELSVEVRAGEIVAVAGLVGSGRTEMARALAGVDRIHAGTLEIDGAPVSLRSARDGIRAGVALIPEDRKDQGLLLGRSVSENLALPNLARLTRGGFVQRQRERGFASELIQRMDVRPPAPAAAVASLSGGNQQKVLFGKWLSTEPKVLVADEPTRGIDAGARPAIYSLLRGLASRGLGVLMISSEIEEIVGLANRVLVMRRGRVVAEFSGDAIAEEPILRAAVLGGG